MPRLALVALSLLLGATLSMPAAAQWKWRDQNGRVQYSDLPPPSGVADKDILQRPNLPTARAPASVPAAAASAAPAGPARKTEDPELEARRKKAEQEEAEKKKADEARASAARAENCRRAQAHLRSLDSGMRVARVAENGEREILDDAQRAAETKRAREVVASQCS